MKKCSVNILLQGFIIITIFTACSPPVGAPAPYGALPDERQLQWHQMETYAMVSFGLNTFTNQEWGYGNVDPQTFNPTSFDAGQVAAAAKSAGLKGLLLVAKHHDGFCLWPTKTTPYNITQSPWKNGRGDLVKEFMEACKQHGLKFGIYCSPWDRNSSLYSTPQYIQQVYRQQLKELCTNYGNLFILWFDGANGGDGYYGGANENRRIDRSSYYDWDTTWKMVRNLQPGAVLFSDIGPDIRWVGNEAGKAADTSWATFTPQPVPGKTKVGLGEIRFEYSPAGTRNGKNWIPAECDVPLRPGWFYHAKEDKQVKSASRLFDIYCKSVGRGAALDLGLAPGPDGLLHPEDVASLAQFGDLLNKTFSKNLAKRAILTASNVRGNDNKRFGAANILDGDRFTYWATDDSVTTPQLVLDMGKEISFDIIDIRENIKLGQRIYSLEADAWTDGTWHTIAGVTGIGNRRLIRLPGYIHSRKIRLRITQSPVCPAISEIGIYATPNNTDTAIANR